MGSDSGGRNYSLTEIFAIKFVLADIVIIATLLFAGPIYALAITALLVVSVFLVWYLMQRTEAAEDRTRAADSEDETAALDPVTKLQHRYADGDLTEAEFEAKLEQVIDANERAERAGIETRELSLERE
ncbi:SHOCT domain-containing protein [Halobacteria archaeon AArc-m2/3/4]|uniref:SHOCT domain-containing protein n=1 Tax=Natronoglomus mannanivorans TaxID=2979990 RepID=A0AAP2YZT4_9EURY|nr:SHOCT domain-containing protein [Halobacteria archaeon AArc-xg1-1]MCU4975204.1 SHOCT domain-containing protein [Halobacteria archaeon AArc-m2/3/4]